MTTYYAIIEVNEPTCAPDRLADKYQWMNALHYGHIEIARAFKIAEPSDVDPAALLAYKVIGTPATIDPPTEADAPTPGSLVGRVCRLEGDGARLGDMVADVQLTLEGHAYRLDAHDRQLSDIANRLRAIETRARQLEGDNR